MNSENNLVSIIMPCYNSASYIENSISSVINQSYSNWEFIIIDDGSTDHTVAKVEELRHKASSKIQLVTNKKNLGADKARNVGIKKAKGVFIAFLDADDLWEPKKLETQINFMIRKDLCFTYTAYNIVYKENIKKISVPLILKRNDLLKNNRICTSTVIYDQEKLGKLFMPSIKLGQDLALWLKIINLTGCAIGLNQVLSTYNKLDSSLSSNKLYSARWVWRLYRKVEKLSFLKSIYFFTHYAINGLVKHLKLK